MHKQIRAILLWGSLLVFAVATPLIILYAMGYRFQKTLTTTASTSVAVFTSVPRGADVTIADEVVGTTPEAITNLTDQSLSVSISHEGYTSWSKNAPLEMGIVNEFRHIRLFPDPLPTNNIAPNTQTFSLSPSRRRIAVVDNANKLSIIDPEGEPLTPRHELNGAPTDVLWSPNSSRVLITARGTVFLYDFDQPTISPTPIAGLSGADDISWDPRLPARILFTNARNQLQALNLDTNNTSTIIDDVLVFAPSTRELYSIPANGSKLVISSLQGEPREEIPLITNRKPEKILISATEHIALQHEDGAITLLNDDQRSFSRISETSEQAGWSPNGELLYVQTDPSAMHVFNHSDETLTWLPPKSLHFVTRRSRPITHPQWFAGGNHLIYQVDDQIQITEIDTRDHPLSHTLASTNLSDAIVTVGADGETLFYLDATSSSNQLTAAQLLLE